ncbi:NAD-dependent epimerase/dehydratase family protein [Candidatus Nitrospira allomarina]|uniref:NAD-dependent epimerase/dehydratase family protein n=1 Tax=Candidatus Nitrospira allomarina TaxID=3020900 RepID=A0AA96JS79_9BACT|nr:NAD-dependent epimerase/dehydratase family protein [Candidatus Nitrospira allomarina]WNM57943.1 NAD-dependent epimerase/dehydratase family protein [Candidatus Nitrospira allomarina]
MGRVLVTGGKGFLGSHLVRRLLAEGEEVRVFGHRGSKQGEALRDNGSEVIWGDIRNLSDVEQAVHGVEKVFHLVSNFRKGGSDKADAYAVNVEGTKNVLKAARKYGVARVVHCSTIGVHGDVQAIPAHEGTPFNPTDLYQETKLKAEQYVWQFHQETGLPISVVRPISLYGPEDLRMLKLFRTIKKRQFIYIGKGNVLFHPAYIDDVIEGFLLCATHDKAVGEAFIIGGDGYLPLHDLVDRISAQFQVPPPRLHIPLRPVEWLATLCESLCTPLGIEPPLHKRRVSFFKNNRAFSIEKVKRVLGYAPRVPLDEGLKRTIRWYEEHGYL